MLLSSSRFLRILYLNALNRSVLKRKSSAMNSNTLSLYEEAVYALNGLQSNAFVLQKARLERSANANRNLIDTEKHLKTLGIKIEDLDALNIIHVAGTKGKGSTCAFTESILRSHGYKTGFYSSPHLISVNERIRINGIPMDKDAFTKYFWKVYRAVESSLKDGETMPPYFMFLTIMAFYVFVMERVEAAVIEVGIGGLYDCTNIIRNPVAVGITTLGIDHVSILGDSLAEIAAQKAGIFKPGVPAFTVSQQESAMRVLREQSRATGCPLVLCPPIEAYEQSVCLGVAGAIQSVNASLALQLSKAWLNYNAKAYSTSVEILNDRCDNISEDEDLSYLPLPVAMPFKLDAKFQEGLKSCVWPGRFQTVEKNKLTFYLDGAHTQQSIRHCIKWFNDVSQQHRMKYQPPVLRILLFNCTGERKAESLLDPLADAHFDLVIFSPNRLTVTKDSSSDLSNFLVEPEKEMQQCITNKEIWNHLIRSMHENELNLALNGNSTPQVKPEISAFNSENSLLFSCLSSAINWLKRFDSVVTHECDINDKNDIFAKMLNNASHIQVLVTGSLHLVGGVLKLIQS